MGSLFPLQGSNPHLLLWKCGVLTTGFPGKAQKEICIQTDMHSGEAEVKQRQGKMAFYQPGEKTQKKSPSPPCPHTDFGLCRLQNCETILVRGLSPTALRDFAVAAQASIWRLTCSTREGRLHEHQGFMFRIFSKKPIYFSLKENGFTAWC